MNSWFSENWLKLEIRLDWISRFFIVIQLRLLYCKFVHMLMWMSISVGFDWYFIRGSLISRPCNWRCRLVGKQHDWRWMEGGAGGERVHVIWASLCVVKCQHADAQWIALYLYCCLMELHSSAFPLIMRDSCWLLYVWYCFLFQRVQPPWIKAEIIIRVGFWLEMFDISASSHSTWVLLLIPKWYFVNTLRNKCVFSTNPSISFKKFKTSKDFWFICCIFTVNWSFCWLKPAARS